MSKNNITLSASFFIFLISAIYIGVVFSDLPQEIPSHFNLKGEPNGFASKNSLFIFLGSYAILSALFFISYHNTNLINLPKRLKNNPSKLKSLLIDLHFVISVLFSYIGLQSVRIAQGHISHLGFGVILLLALLISRIIFIYHEIKKS